MNTRLVMTVSAIIMGIAGMLMTFIPDLILNYLDVNVDKTTVFAIQILGALYFAFAMFNWMNKRDLIGGIYNRPLAVANVCHYSIAGLALVNGLMSNPNLSPIIWTAGIIYAVLAIVFGLILMRHPLSESTEHA